MRLAIATVIGIAALAARGANAPEWENERVFGINKEPPHATSIP